MAIDRKKKRKPEYEQLSTEKKTEKGTDIVYDLRSELVEQPTRNKQRIPIAQNKDATPEYKMNPTKISKYFGPQNNENLKVFYTVEEAMEAIFNNPDIRKRKRYLHEMSISGEDALRICNNKQEFLDDLYLNSMKLLKDQYIAEKWRFKIRTKIAQFKLYLSGYTGGAVYLLSINKQNIGIVHKDNTKGITNIGAQDERLFRIIEENVAKLLEEHGPKDSRYPKIHYSEWVINFVEFVNHSRNIHPNLSPNKVSFDWDKDLVDEDIKSLLVDPKYKDYYEPYEHRIMEVLEGRQRDKGGPGPSKDNVSKKKKSPRDKKKTQKFPGFTFLNKQGDKNEQS